MYTGTVTSCRPPILHLLPDGGVGVKTHEEVYHVAFIFDLSKVRYDTMVT